MCNLFCIYHCDVLQVTVRTSSGADDFFGGYTMYLFDRTMRIFLFMLHVKSKSLLCYLPQTNNFSSPGYTWCGVFSVESIFVFAMQIAVVIHPRKYCPDVYLLGCLTQCTCTRNLKIELVIGKFAAAVSLCLDQPITGPLWFALLRWGGRSH